MPAKLRSSLFCNPRVPKLMWHSAKKKLPQQYLTTYRSFGSGRRSPANTFALRAFALRRPCAGFLVWARIFEKMPGRWSRWDSTTRSDFSSNPLDWCSWRYSLRTAGFCLLLLEIRLPVVFMTIISVFSRSSEISGVPVFLQ